MSMETERQQCCPLCGEGTPSSRFEGLRDGLWDVPGEWSMRECATCGAFWLDPRPTEADIGKAYAGYYTHGGGGLARKVALATARLVARQRHERGVVGQAVRWLTAMAPGVATQMDLASRYLEPQQGATLLDVGCGDGASLDWLRDLGWNASGVEIDPAGVAAARAARRPVTAGTAADLEDETFDVVTASHVIEHVHDPKAFLAHCRRIVRPGGKVVMVTPNARSPMLAMHGEHWVQLDAPRHLVLFNADNLRNLAGSVGFSQIEIHRTARAVAWSHIASTELRRAGHYRWNAPGGLRLWIEAQALQRKVSRAVRSGAEGEELVLIATR
jgi:2-polyprenyl-3-methyl-5-hydroxy-6-metoxy-1,4-benzoquinol methylase